MANKQHRTRSVREALARLKVRDRDLGVLWEDMHGQFEAAVEGYTFLSHRIVHLEEQFGERFNHLERILQEHERILQEHTRITGEIRRDIEITKQDIASIKGDSRKRVELDQFTRLERRVALLERRQR